MTRSILFLVLITTAFLAGCGSAKKATTAGVSESRSGEDEAGYSFVFINAAKEKMLGNYEVAAVLFREAIKLNPKDPAAYYELAHILYMIDHKEEALQLAAKATELNPKNTWYRIFYIGLLDEKDDLPSLVKEITTLSSQYPKNIDYRFELADALMRSGKLNEAVKELDEVEKIIGVTEEVSRHKQRIYLAMNNLDKAVEEANKLINSNPDSPRLLNQLADIYRSNDKTEEALLIYKQILRIDSTDPGALLALADHYRENGSPEKSMKYLAKAFANPEMDIDSKVKILLSFYVLSEENNELKTEAYRLVNILEETHPGEAKTYSITGDFLIRDSRFAEAREKFLKALELDPSRQPIWTQVLLLDSQLGRFEDLLKDSDKAIELFPTSPAFYYFKGVASSRLKDNEGAVEAFTNAAAMVVDDRMLSAQIQAGLGDAYHALEMHPESDMAYEAALKADPSNVFVLNNYSYYLALRSEKLERAATMAKKANELQPGTPSFQDTYGYILYLQENYTEAEVWLKKAVSSGGSAVILEHYGDVLSRLNRNEEATRYWKEALTKDPENKPLQEKINLGRLP